MQSTTPDFANAQIRGIYIDAYGFNNQSGAEFIYISFPAQVDNKKMIAE